MALVIPTKLVAGRVDNFKPGDMISAIYGGTGLSSYTAGDLIIGASSTTLTTVAATAPGNVLLSAGVGVAPVWGQLNLSNVVGTLSVIRGGTGFSSYTIGNYLNAATNTTLQQRTPSQVLSDIGAAPLSHTHATSDITSGIFPVVQLGTGVPTASTYLRGDGAWSSGLLTLGNVSISLGNTVTTLTGLTSVTSTTFIGALTGNATTATSTTNSTNASNLTITDDTTTNAIVYPTWVTAATGNLPQKVSSGKLSFNPSSGVLSAVSFNGAATLSTLSASGLVTVSNSTQSTTPTDGALVVAGGVGVGADVNIQGDLVVHGITFLGDTIGDITEVGVIGALTTFSASTASTAPDQVIATINGDIYRSAELRIQAHDAVSNRLHTSTILVVHNNSIAHFVEFGDIDINGSCGLYKVDFLGSYFRLLVTPTSANLTTFKIVGMLTKV